jgi:hypothetical protein
LRFTCAVDSSGACDSRAPSIRAKLKNPAMLKFPKLKIPEKLKIPAMAATAIRYSL